MHSSEVLASMLLKPIKTEVPAFERLEMKLILPVVAGFSFHIALCSCIIVIKPGYETRLLDISPQLPPQSEDKSNDVTMSLLSDLFWYSEIWGEKRNHLSFNPLVKKRSSGVWSERMLTPYYPPVTSMTSVCPGCPSELAARTSRQSAWPAATLYVLTASLCKLNVFACVCVCVCVCACLCLRECLQCAWLLRWQMACQWVWAGPCHLSCWAWGCEWPSSRLWHV